MFEGVVDGVVVGLFVDPVPGAGLVVPEDPPLVLPVEGVVVSAGVLGRQFGSAVVAAAAVALPLLVAVVVLTFLLGKQPTRPTDAISTRAVFSQRALEKLFSPGLSMPKILQFKYRFYYR